MSLLCSSVASSIFKAAKCYRQHLNINFHYFKQYEFTRFPLYGFGKRTRDLSITWFTQDHQHFCYFQTERQQGHQILFHPFYTGPETFFDNNLGPVVPWILTGSFRSLVFSPVFPLQLGKKFKTRAWKYMNSTETTSFSFETFIS